MHIYYYMPLSYEATVPYDVGLHELHEFHRIEYLEILKRTYPVHVMYVNHECENFKFLDIIPCNGKVEKHLKTYIPVHKSVCSIA